MVSEQDILNDQSGGAESSRSFELSSPSSAKEVRHLAPLWRNRDFMLLWSSQLLSSVGSEVSLLAFPLLVLGITHSAIQAGLVGALRSLPFALLCLPAGAFIDRWDRKRVMLICDTGRALALGSIPVALWLDRLGLFQLCLVALVEGTLMTFFSVAEIACLPHVVPKAQIPAASAQNQAIDSTSWTLGPFLGGFLYGVGHAVPFLTDTISYVCSVLSIFLMRARFQEERTEEPRKIWHEIGEGLLWLWREHVLRFQALLTLGLVFPTVGFTLILIVQAQNLHAMPLAIGMLFASGGVGSIAGAVLSGPLQKRFAVGPLTIGAAWIWAVSWLPLAVAPNLWVLGVANGVSFIVVPVFYSVQSSYRLIAIPDHLQGRVQSVFRLLSLGSMPLGLALAGLLIQWVGPGQTVVLLFVPQALIALFATLNRRLRAIPPLSDLARKDPE